MNVSLQTVCQFGQTYTIAFIPTGLGNPTDNATDWYTAAPSFITVQNVNMNGNLFANNEIDVTFQLDPNYPTSAATLSDVANVFTTNLASTFWGYQVAGADLGNGSPLNNTNNSNGLNSLLPKGTSTTLYWVVGGLVAIGLALMFVRKQV